MSDSSGRGTLINFCHPCMKPKVNSNAISCDNYEITNLISNETDKRNRGYLAYNAIKPPVTITLNFVCNINIDHIVIWPEVGGQKSTGLAICANFGGLEDASENYRQIGYKNLQENEFGFIFHDRQMHPNSFQTPKHSGFVFQEFQRQPLRGTNCIQIKIVRTQSSVPALRSIEVWGFPANYYPLEEMSYYFNLWHSRTDRLTSQPIKVHHRTLETCTNQSNTNDILPLSCLEFLIPDEFLDSLTYEVMVLPMILPCGKIIDQSTLKKHARFEESWGRGPSDPFTGVPFSHNNHPVVAVALKARIDKFLVENSNEEQICKLPRTLGRNVIKPTLISRTNKCFAVSTITAGKTNNSSQSISCLKSECSTASPKVESKTLYTLGGYSGQSPPLMSYSLSAQTVNDTRELNNAQCLKRKQITLQIENSKLQKMCLDSASSTQLIRNISNTSSPMDKTFYSCVAKDDDSSLDTALKSVLTGLPSFVNSSVDRCIRKLPFKCKEVLDKLKFVRSMLPVTRRNKIRNGVIWKRVRVQGVHQIVKETRLRWYGHVMKMEKRGCQRKGWK